MSKKRIHIDQLFKNGLKHLSFLVSNKDLESIDKKTEVYSDEKTNKTKDKLDQFNFPITDLDWEQTFSKFQKEKLAFEPSKSIFSKLDELELPITEVDWTQTKNKLANQKRRRVFIWWKVASLLLILGLFAIIYKLSISETTKQRNEISESVHLKSMTLNENINKNNPSKDINKSDKYTLNTIIKNNVTKPPFRNALKEPAFNGSSLTLISKNETIKIEENQDIEATNQLVLVGLSLFDIIYPNLNFDLVQTNTIVKPPTKTMKTQYFVGLNNALLTNQFKYDKNNDANFNNLQQNADRNLLSWSKGINFGLIHKGFQHQISLSGQQINQKSNYQFKARIFDSLPVKDPSGNVIGYFLTRGRDTTLRENHQIKRNRIDFAFNTNKIWKMSSKINLVTGIGAQTSFTLNSKGSKTLDPQTIQINDYQFVKSNERKLGIHPMVYIGIQTSLSKNWILETALSSQYNILPVYKNNISNKINTYQSGIHLKILYLIK
ncbi:MAG: hypothetical protein Q8K70_03050 [Bacteroidota bacterium]|nr:hypothetical protein [Bacteroidota bacterium]